VRGETTGEVDGWQDAAVRGVRAAMNLFRLRNSWRHVAPHISRVVAAVRGATIVDGGARE
jgi:hypothetical protein